MTRLSWSFLPARNSSAWRDWALHVLIISCAQRSGRWSLDVSPLGRARSQYRAIDRLCMIGTERNTRLTTGAMQTSDAPAMRGADPSIVLVPGIGMFAFGKNKQTARISSEFYLNAINVMRGAESVSTYAPIAESREIPRRVLGAGRGQAAAFAATSIP